MLILALESSAKAASVALMEDEKLVAQYSQCSGLTHSRTLLPMVDDMLKNTENTVAGVDLIAVAHGPGSFTGIRIGVSTVKGLAWAADKMCVGVSTLEAMAWHGVPAGGTMAHSWVQMFDSELDAFRAYCQTYPTNATLLVDTYNSLQSGVPNAIRAFNEVLRPKGITHCGIRFDSGDIAYLTKKARKMLDDAGWPDCKITVSNALDERLIAGLLRQGAQVDSFGVGERLITARSEPVFGGVYKLAAIEDENGNIIPKIKISENVGKITNPHFKKVYRFYSKDSGMAEADYICLHDEVVDDTQPLEICDPDATWKKKVLTDFTARELLVPIFRDGRLVYQKPALDDIRAYCAQQLTTLWPEVLRFDYPHNYYVDLSEKLLKIKLELLNAGGKSQG